MKIELEKVLVDLVGKDIKVNDESFTVGRAVSLILAGGKSKDPLKAYLLAQKFYSDPSIELDKSEEKFVKEAVEESQMYSPLIIGQVLSLLG